MIPSLHIHQHRAHGVVLGVGLLACMALGYLLGEIIYRLTKRYALSQQANNENTDTEAGALEAERARRREAKEERLREGTRKVNLLPLVSFNSEEFVSCSMECAICLEDFEGADMCRVIVGCNHAFHAQCVDVWLKKKQRCPVCRQAI